MEFPDDSLYMSILSQASPTGPVGGRCVSVEALFFILVLEVLSFVYLVRSYRAESPKKCKKV